MIMVNIKDLVHSFCINALQQNKWYTFFPSITMTFLKLYIEKSAKASAQISHRGSDAL